MKKWYLGLGLSCLAYSFSSAQASAKRRAPKEVSPVVVNNIKYTAPTNQMGYILARDLMTDSLVWRKQVYTIRYNKFLEQDVQDVFIDSLYTMGGNLMVRTESGKTYSVKIKE